MGQMYRRSNVVYQDGLRNVNSMIFNSQVDLLKVPSGKIHTLRLNQCIESQQAVEEKEMKLERMGSRSKWEKETVTLVPNIESVSSTAMVMQVEMNTMFQTLCSSYFYKSKQFEQVKILLNQISSLALNRILSILTPPPCKKFTNLTSSEHPIQGAL